eukprot:754068-Hanusia_phi.AAC.1
MSFPSSQLRCQTFLRGDRLSHSTPPPVGIKILIDSDVSDWQTRSIKDAGWRYPCAFVQHMCASLLLHQLWQHPQSAGAFHGAKAWREDEDRDGRRLWVCARQFQVHGGAATKSFVSSQKDSGRHR